MQRDSELMRLIEAAECARDEADAAREACVRANIVQQAAYDAQHEADLAVFEYVELLRARVRGKLQVDGT